MLMLMSTRFRYRKVFLAWKRWIRSNRFEAARDHLISTLYFSSAPLLSAMRDAQLEIAKLEAIQLMWNFEGKTTTLENFAIHNVSKHVGADDACRSNNPIIAHCACRKTMCTRKE